MTITKPEVEVVCRLVDDLTGIQWDAQKTYLIESRLQRLVTEHACADLTELVSRIRKGDEQLKETVIDAVTTRETLFFRDDAPFAALRNKALPEIIDAKTQQPGSQRLRIWSAACSSGQEPYSLGITLLELLDDISDWDIVISASDLSASAIESARNGIYSDFEMSRGVSPQIKQKYFKQVPGGWQICDRVRKMVSFHQRNLLEPFGELGPFDIIFCRNVAIYFDGPTKDDLFVRLADVLALHGAIFVGGSESLSAMGDRWKPQHHCRGVFYQPNRKDIPEPAIVTSSRMMASAPVAIRPRVNTALPPRPAPAGLASAQTTQRPKSQTPATPLNGQVSARPAHATRVTNPVTTAAPKALASPPPGRPMATQAVTKSPAPLATKSASTTTVSAAGKMPNRPTTATAALPKGMISSTAKPAVHTTKTPVGAVKQASVLTKGIPAPTSLIKPSLIKPPLEKTPLAKTTLPSASSTSAQRLSGGAKAVSPGVATPSSMFAKSKLPKPAQATVPRPITGISHTGTSRIPVPHSLTAAVKSPGSTAAAKTQLVTTTSHFAKKN